MNKRKRTILNEIKIFQTYVLFFFGVIWLTLFGIFSLSKGITNNSDVKGANTVIYNKVNENHFNRFTSKSLNLDFVYDNRFLKVSEKENYINLSMIDKDLTNLNASLGLTQKEISKIYPKLNIVDTIKVNDVSISLFTFIKPSFSKNEETNIDYLTVIHKQLANNKTVYLQIWGYDYEKDQQITELFVNVINSITVPGQNISNSQVLSATTSMVNQAQILGQASTVRIYSKECNNVKFSNELNNLNIQGKTYIICSAGFGSGFVVNDNGNVVTNAHVVNIDNLDSLIEGSSVDGTFEKDFIADLTNYLVSEFDTTTLSQITEEQMIYFVTSLIVDLNNNGKITITDKDREIYIQGDTVFKNDPKSGELLEKEKYFKANLIQSTPLTSYYQSIFSEDTSITQVADLAILHVAGDFNLPSIPINTNGFSIGQTIYVVGYPAIADDSELISSTQVLSSSITKGSISSIKPNTSNTFDLVQIDAAIQGGNSGGPIMDEDGNVIAVATYSISSDSGNYNYGVSSKELQTFLGNSSIEVKVNPLRKDLEKSLSDVSLSYYKKAKISLEKLVASQPTLNVTLQPVIKLCQDRINAGEDKTPMLNINNRILTIIILVILILLLIFAIVFLIINIKNISKKKKELSHKPNFIT